MRSPTRSVSLTAGAPSLSAGAETLSPSDRTGPLAKSITQGVATIKRLLLTGGLLRSVEWHQPIGDKDVRGRQAVSVTLLDALIEQRPELDRSAGATDRSDNTTLTILDPVAIKDADTFRWGGHTYKVSKIDGVVKNETTGVRFSSEVTVIGDTKGFWSLSITDICVSAGAVPGFPELYSLSTECKTAGELTWPRHGCDLAPEARSRSRGRYYETDDRG